MKEKIRVLQVIGSLNNGGSQSMIMQLYRNLDKSKIQFDFVIFKKDELFYKDEIEKLGGKIYTLPEYKIYNHFKYKKAWKDFLKQHPEYKIIHSHVRSTASIYFKIAKRMGKTTIAHSHSTSSGKGLKAIVKTFLQYNLRNVADYCMGCSKTANIWLYGEKVANSNRAYVFKNSIDTDKFLFNDEIRNKIKNEYKIKDDEVVIGHVGRFFEVKNHEFLIEIYNAILKKEEKSKLLLVGDGELRNKIEEKVKLLGIENQVIFTGNQKNVYEIMQAMDIFIMPSIYEGFPVTLVEAQATGLKCLITDNITNEVCITNLVEKEALKNSEAIWAEHAIKMLKENVKRCEYNQIVKKSGYDIKENTKILEEIYERIMAGEKNVLNSIR